MSYDLLLMVLEFSVSEWYVTLLVLCRNLVITLVFFYYWSMLSSSFFFNLERSLY